MAAIASFISNSINDGSIPNNQTLTAVMSTVTTNVSAITTKLLTAATATLIKAATTTITSTSSSETLTSRATGKSGLETESELSSDNSTITSSAYAEYAPLAAATEEYFQLYDDEDDAEGNTNGNDNIINAAINMMDNKVSQTEEPNDVENENENYSFIEGITDWLTNNETITNNNNNNVVSDNNDSSSLLLNIWQTLIGGGNQTMTTTNATTTPTATATMLTTFGNNDNFTLSSTANATTTLPSGDGHQQIGITGSSNSWHDNVNDVTATLINNTNDDSSNFDLFSFLHASNSTDMSSSDSSIDNDAWLLTTDNSEHGLAIPSIDETPKVKFHIRYSGDDDDSALQSGVTTISTASLENTNGTTYYFHSAMDKLASKVSRGNAGDGDVGDAEGNADLNIALIDSAESALDTDTDYGLLGFNGGGIDGDGIGVDDTVYAASSSAAAASSSSTSDLIQRSLAYNTENSNSYSALHNRTAASSLLDGITDLSTTNGINNNGAGSGSGNGGSTFMLLLEDFGEYFYNYNGSTAPGTTAGGVTSAINTNLTTFIDNRTLCMNLTANGSTASCYDITEVDHNYWALILILFPILTLFGNILVILSVCRERSLQTVTNYFIVSLAIADLLVAVVVMPFAVYVLVNGIWALPNFVCDFYIAMDVICSTSSIFNLVAISIDRYIAVTQPIKYAKHKNSRRVCLTILLVWAISAAIGSPIVLGLNNTPNRDPDVCAFYNADFILYSSLSSFYIPCIIMVFLYWNIFKALRSRARKQRAARKPHLSELTGGSVIENIAQTRRLAETALDNSRHASRIMPDEPATNTASGSNEEEDENAISPDIDDCHVIVNDKSTEFMLATVVEETGNVVAQITTQPQLVVADPNGNHDSGYAPSNVDDVLAGGTIASSATPPDSPIPSGATLQRSSVSSRRNIDAGGAASSGGGGGGGGGTGTGTDTGEDTPKRGAGGNGEPALSVAMKPLSFVRYGVQEAITLARNDSTLSTTSKTSSRKDKKNSQASRFTIYKVHKASKKKREKSSAKKERKATKTLAIVLGVFLFCWLPFFSCNIMDAMCAKFNKDCRPGVTAYILTTWLGYINSFVNPVIYTIFNPEFRKAFKKIMHMG